MSDPFGTKETVVRVIEHDGTVWELGKGIPRDEASTVITGMYVVDGAVDVFALPKPGTELDGQKLGMHFTLLPLGIKLVLSVARFNEWQRIAGVIEKSYLEATQEVEEEDEDDDEEYEDEDEAPPPFAAQPVPMPNGGGFPQGLPAFAPQPVAQVAPQPVAPQPVAQVAPQPVAPPLAAAPEIAPTPQSSYLPTMSNMPVPVAPSSDSE